jgi:hypothetical protein
MLRPVLRQFLVEGPQVAKKKFSVGNMGVLSNPDDPAPAGSISQTTGFALVCDIFSVYSHEILLFSVLCDNSRAEVDIGGL